MTREETRAQAARLEDLALTFGALAVQPVALDGTVTALVVVDEIPCGTVLCIDRNGKVKGGWLA